MRTMADPFNMRDAHTSKRNQEEMLVLGDRTISSVTDNLGASLWIVAVS
jgi:hypothetical protein